MASRVTNRLSDRGEVFGRAASVLLLIYIPCDSPSSSILCNVMAVFLNGPSDLARSLDRSLLAILSAPNYKVDNRSTFTRHPGRKVCTLHINLSK